MTSKLLPWERRVPVGIQSGRRALSAPGARSQALLAVFVLALAAQASAQVGPQMCGDPFRNHFGPFDYRRASAETKKLVEDAHFTVGIQSLTKPQNTMFRDMAQDVSYTLNVFPNHPRALLTMHRLATRWKSDPAPGTLVTVECWFDRAVRFRPDDTVVRSLYAKYLGDLRRTEESLRQLKLATEHAKDNPISHYNIGLVYLEFGQFDLALEQAHKAIAMGYARPELVDALKKAGKWAEPAATESK